MRIDDERVLSVFDSDSIHSILPMGSEIACKTPTSRPAQHDQRGLRCFGLDARRPEYGLI